MSLQIPTEPFGSYMDQSKYENLTTGGKQKFKETMRLSYSSWLSIED